MEEHQLRAAYGVAMTHGDVVVTEVDAGISVLRLNRPHRRNAIDHALVEGLASGFRDAERRGDAAVVLTGGDSFFSAGGDVGSMPSASDGLFGAAGRLALIHDLIEHIRRSDMVVIAAVEGYAVGVSWGLVLACDLVVAAEDAFFAAPFAERGLAADGGAAYHLSRRLGPQRAARHLLLGDRLPADAAFDAGLVSEVVEPSTSTGRARDLAARLAAGPRESNAVTKRLMTSSTADLSSFLASERMAVALAGHGADAAEGRLAFAERRDPRFR
ncbi:2-(1,2-epoxy-1,2-dihydrophenyl)acetyl-CoA isomerase [Pseudonocardia autotrophica]|uniref:2,3-dehydroadipyl-CoA hydratase n=2 Tax=Pseudonocardiaceae TaxID=2070 RepID=A0A1Y2MMZ9_PSEAH|nr:2,3-dehydroadipyl-CoA hydratase [Pseudonocardia autotrophica]TDN73132.1 2-(1,2-epoxy-1,2-dihydrophenyl)acetyl-CoA isomerase [Pseudonocardia autotrophica]BBG03851.1 enoyl-CoA hydratase [Pseudonocardia autotrophica]